MNKIITKGLVLVFVLISKSLALQEHQEQITIYDSYDLMIENNVEIEPEGFLQNDYLIGSVKYMFSEGDFATPSGLIINIFRLFENGEETKAETVFTNAKGMFYVNNMRLGMYRIDIEQRGVVISSKFFALVNPEYYFLPCKR